MASKCDLELKSRGMSFDPIIALSPSYYRAFTFSSWYRRSLCKHCFANIFFKVLNAAWIVFRPFYGKGGFVLNVNHTYLLIVVHKNAAVLLQARKTQIWTMYSKPSTLNNSKTGLRRKTFFRSKIWLAETKTSGIITLINGGYSWVSKIHAVSEDTAWPRVYGTGSKKFISMFH